MTTNEIAPVPRSRRVRTGRAVLFDEVGGPEVLRVADVEIPDPGPGEVLLRIDAIGLNRGEALFRAGAYWLPPTLPASRIGHEAAGVVEAVGVGVDALRVGEEVSTVTIADMSAHGVHGDHAVVPAAEVVPRPAGTDPVTGAATWLAYTTAYGALVETARLRPGDTVLVTAAAGAVGIAAVRVANHLGAVPVVTTRDPAKQDRLLEAGAAHVVPAGPGLLDEVRALTGGRGADVVLDAVAGPGLDILAQAVAPEGMLIVTSNLDPRPTPLPWTWPLDLRKYANPVFYAADPARMQRAGRFIAAGLRTGAFAPLVARTFDLAEIVDAHRFLEADGHVGKVVITVQH